MRSAPPGPPMKLGNMRSLGVRSLAVTCEQRGAGAGPWRGDGGIGGIGDRAQHDQSRHCRAEGWRQ